MLTSFEQLNLIPELKSAIAEIGYTLPTPVQAEAIPFILDGRDILAEAPTGTGKTAAFGLPILNKINPYNDDVQALIVCPTRELAMQTEREIKKFAINMPNIKVMTVCGGQNYQRQLASIRRKPSIIVGTPGRIMDHLNKRTLKINNIKMLVLDEADEMLNMGFREDIDSILSWVESHHQTLLFSATMTKEIMAISANYQKNPEHIKTKHNDNIIPQIDQLYIRVKENKKLDAFVKIWHDNDYRLAIIFCNTKRRVDELNKQLDEMNYLSAAIHGDLRQRERDYVMKKFRNGDINILIATDVAARGIDVDNIEAVFNYDMPSDDEYYIHRIGRTARAGKEGVSFSFVSDKDYHKLAIYERMTKTTMTEMSIAGLTNDKPIKLKGKKAEKTTDRYFVNFGTMDKFDERSLKEILLNKAALPDGAIDEVKVLETYSFIEVEKEFKSEILDINGLSIGRRKLAIELAGVKTSDSPRSSGGGAKSYGTRSNSGGSDYKPRESSGGSDYKPRERSGGSDYKPRERSGGSDYKPRESSGGSDYKPRESSGGSDYKPRERSGGSDYKPRERSGGSDYKPRERSGGSDYKPRESSGGSDYKPRERSGGSDYKPRESSGGSDYKPRERSGGSEYKPRERSGGSDYKPRESSGGSDYKPRESSGGSDYKPRERSGGSDYKPRERSGGSDYKPRERSGGSDYKPRESSGGSDYKPRESSGGSDYKPRESSGGSDYKPRERSGGSDYKPRERSEGGEYKPKRREGGDATSYGNKSTVKPTSSGKPSYGQNSRSSAPRGYKKFDK